MTTRTRFSCAGLALSTLMLLGACGDGGSSPDRQGPDSSDEEKTGTQATPAPATPEIISRTRGGSTVLQVQGSTLPLPAVPGITVRLTHRETLPAEEAFAVAFFVPRTASGPNARLAPEDEAKLRAALAAAGFKDEDVTVSSNPQFGPQTSIRVRVPVASLSADAKRVFAVITGSIGTPEQTGAQFALRDCATGLNVVRQSALAKARERANSIARAGELSPGAIVAVLESQGTNPYGPPADDPCDPAASFPFKGYGSLVSVDSKPEVEVVMDVAVTFSLGDAASSESAGGISATGSGSVTAKADEAYVIVLIESFSGPTGPRPIADRDRQGVIDALKPFGVAEEDIEFFSPPYGGPTVVSVETGDLTNLAKFGDDVSDAIEELLGRSINQGVVFSHSNCEGAKAEARKEAIADARAKAEGLAIASGSKLSRTLRLVAEVAGQSPYGPPPIDPCEDDLTSIAQNGYGSADIKPFNARPEFTVRVVLNVLYAID